MASDREQVKPGTGAQPDPAADAAKSDVDRLLSEFEEGKAAPKTDYPNIKPLIEAIKPLATYTTRKMQEETAAAGKKSVADAVSAVKSVDELKEIPDRVVRGYLQDRYVEDVEFRAAYDKQGENPQAWQAQLAKAREAFAEDIKVVAAKGVRSDVEAAKAAVKGAGKSQDTNQEESVDALFAMSDAQFRAFKEKKAAGARP